MLTLFRVKLCNCSFVTIILLSGSQTWLYVAKYIPPQLPEGKEETPRCIQSDAALLELVASIAPLKIEPFAVSINFCVVAEYKICKSNSTPEPPAAMSANRNIIVPAMRIVGDSSLGSRCDALPLVTLNNRHTGPSVSASATGQLLKNNSFAAVLHVEQIVQICGYSADASAVDCNWARVVSRQGELYLASVYSDHNLVGGPVLDKEGNLVAVVSAIPYKRGTQSAFFLASLNEIESPLCV